MGYLTGYDDANGSVLEDIRRERFRQDELKAKGAFKYTCADSDKLINPFEKLAILMEEVGEVANACLQKGDLNTRGDRVKELRKELIQVAAVCAAWVESIDADK